MPLAPGGGPSKLPQMFVQPFFALSFHEYENADGDEESRPYRDFKQIRLFGGWPKGIAGYEGQDQRCTPGEPNEQ